jgi:metallo-beta-lactamase class B
MVYADSLTPASTDGFKFTNSREYPGAVKDFEKSFAFLEAAACDFVISTHPDATGLWDRLASGKVGVADPCACRRLAADAREQVRLRLAEEKKKQ